jgi:hypothetical protein
MKLKNLFSSDTRPAGDPFAREEQDGCCGQHALCLKDRKQPELSDPVDYYDDEELDAFQGHSSGSYTEDEIARFAEVLHTMLETDIPGWIRSLQLRGIELPDRLKEEVLWIIQD